MFKKLIALFMALTVMLLASCNNDGKPSNTEPPEPEDKYVETEDGAVLRIFVDQSEIKQTASTRPYDESKEDISLILVIGQSNFTYMAGYAWEYSHYYIKQISDATGIPAGKLTENV